MGNNALIKSKKEFMGILDFIINEFKTNDMLVGIMGGSMGAGAFYLLKDIPRNIFDFLLKHLTSKLLITNDRDPRSFRQLLFYIQRNYKRRLRQISFRVLDDVPTLGYGTHIYNIMGKTCIIEYYASQGDSVAVFIKEEISITAFTWDGHGFFEKVFKDALKLNENKLRVYVSHDGYWSQVDSPQHRPLNTVVLAENIRESIISPIKNYIRKKDYFLERGIPRKLSFLFEGPPGTGKTSMVAALATEFKLPVYSLLFGSVKGDSELMQLLNDVPAESIILIEDIDCAGLPARGDDVSEENKITLSGVLNALDGISVPQGRILIMTSNDSSKLDMALKRRGRIDHIITFDNLADKEVDKLYGLLGMRRNGDNFNNPAEIECIARQR